MAATPITIEHRISAGNDFDGTVPSTTPVDDPDTGIRAFPADDNGGLIEFGFSSNYWLMELVRISGDFGDAATVDISIVSGSDEVVLYSGAVGGDLIITDNVKLLADEKISIVTTGATLAMFVRVTGRPSLSKP